MRIIRERRDNNTVRPIFHYFSEFRFCTLLVFRRCRPYIFYYRQQTLRKSNCTRFTTRLRKSLVYIWSIELYAIIWQSSFANNPFLLPFLAMPSYNIFIRGFNARKAWSDILNVRYSFPGRFLYCSGFFFFSVGNFFFFL